MKQVIVRINLVNAELADDPDYGVARLLKGLSVKVLEDGVASIKGVKLRDINGNTVGSCEIKGVQSAD